MIYEGRNRPHDSHLLEFDFRVKVAVSIIRLRHPRNIDDQLVSGATCSHRGAGREQRPSNSAVAALQGAESEVGKALLGVLVCEQVAQRAVVHILFEKCRQARRGLQVGSGGQGAVVGPDEGVDCDEPVAGGDLLHLVLAVGKVRNMMVLSAARPVVGAHAKFALEAVVPNHASPTSEGRRELDYQSPEHSNRLLGVLVGLEMTPVLVKQQLV